MELGLSLSVQRVLLERAYLVELVQKWFLSTDNMWLQTF